MATATENAIQQIYIGLLGRSADPEGLAYWAAEIDGETLTLEQLRANIVNEQPEYATGLGLLTRSQTVEALYQNMFERAADDEGLEYWVNGGGSTVNTDQLVLALVNGAAAADTLVLDNKTEAAIYYTENTAQDDFTTDSATASVDDVDSTSESVDASKTATDNGSQTSGQTFTLTTSVDAFVGTANNDTFNGLDTTLTALDSLDGGAGTDTLNINDVAGGLSVGAAQAISNIETATFRSAGGQTVDSSTWTGLTTLNSTQSVATTLTAAATTAINASGATGLVTVDGGSSVDVTTAAAAGVTVGATTAAAGAVTVTHTAQAANALAVDGGTDSTVTASGVTTGTTTVGAVTAATGDTSVTATGAAYTAATAVTLGAIAATGGDTITVDVNASSDTSAAAADGAAAIRTQSAVTVVADATTTAVTVTQDDQVAAVNAVTAVSGVTGTSVVTFIAMTAGQTVIIDGLTFTAGKALTAAEAAAAFASLSASDTQEAGGPSANGTYTGTLSANFTSGAVVGDTVTFSQSVAGTGAIGAMGGTAAPSVAAGVTGVTAVTGVTGVMAVANGIVLIDDDATASITSVSVDGYAAGSKIGNTTALDSLTTVTLANSGAADMDIDTAATTLALSLNDVDGAVDIDNASASVTTLNLSAVTEDSSSALTATLVTALNVSGDATASLTADLEALATVVVTGTAGLTLAAATANTVTSIDTSGTTGTVSASIDGTAATYTGGAGVDNATVTTTTITKAIDLAGGDDTLTLGATLTAATGGVLGGAGTDTISMTGVNAAALDASTVFSTQATGFERLNLTAVDGTVGSFNMANLGFNYVTIDGAVDDGAGADEVVTFTGLTSGATVNVTGVIGLQADDDTVVVTLADVTGTETVNLGVTAAGALAAGEVVVAGVEAFNIVTTDTTTDVVAGTNAQSLELTAVNATSITVTGNSAFELIDNAANTALTSIDASGMTGSLKVTAAGTTAVTITGGAGNDTFVASAAGDTLNGGAGNDSLTAGDLAQLTGGAGVDTFVVTNGTATVNVNSYATILDASSGDKVQFDAGVFKSAGVTLGDTAVFQDYANAAVNSSTANDDILWFQFAGNTYILQDQATGGGTFVNGTDTIIKMTGLVDLSTASFNVAGTIEIA